MWLRSQFISGCDSIMLIYNVDSVVFVLFWDKLCFISIGMLWVMILDIMNIVSIWLFSISQKLVLCQVWGVVDLFSVVFVMVVLVVMLVFGVGLWNSQVSSGSVRFSLSMLQIRKVLCQFYVLRFWWLISRFSGLFILKFRFNRLQVMFRCWWNQSLRICL